MLLVREPGARFTSSFLASVFPKPTTWRSKKYKRWVETQDCMLCGHPGWDDNQIITHHAIGIPGLDLGKMGGKANDSFGIPLHVTCHRQFHDQFGKYKEDQIIWLIKTMEKAIRNFAPTP